jgi:hypothetical protein
MNQVAAFVRVYATVLFVSLSQAANATRPNILLIWVEDFETTAASGEQSSNIAPQRPRTTSKRDKESQSCFLSRRVC